MRRRINENDIARITKKILNEDNEFVTGPAFSETTELVDDVINRIKEHGAKYIMQLNKLNFQFPVERTRRQQTPKRGDFELPKGVKVSRSTFPDEI
jgi:hypothetical protein